MCPKSSSNIRRLLAPGTPVTGGHPRQVYGKFIATGTGLVKEITWAHVGVREHVVVEENKVISKAWDDVGHGTEHVAWCCVVAMDQHRMQHMHVTHCAKMPNDSTRAHDGWPGMTWAWCILTRTGMTPPNTNPHAKPRPRSGKEHWPGMRWAMAHHHRHYDHPTLAPSLHTPFALTRAPTWDEVGHGVDGIRVKRRGVCGVWKQRIAVREPHVAECVVLHPVRHNCSGGC